MDLRELRNAVEAIDITYDYEQSYSDLYNTVIDYSNENQDFRFDSNFDDYISYDVAEEMAKRELEDGGLLRLWYFMGDCNFNNNLFRIDGYGNLADITKEDLENLKEEILESIDYELEDEE